MENILKKRLGVFVVLFVISFYFMAVYLDQYVKKTIKCPMIKNHSDGKVVYLPSYYAHDGDLFYFNWDAVSQKFQNRRYKQFTDKYGFETTDYYKWEDKKNPRNMFFWYDQDIFKYVKFRANTSMGFVWVTYKTKSGSSWYQQPELKLYGCHRISKSELPKYEKRQ